MSVEAIESSPATLDDGPGDVPLDDYLAETFGGLITHQPPQSTPATDRLFSRLDEDDVREVLSRLDPQTHAYVNQYLGVNHPRAFRREVLCHGTHHLPDRIGAKTGLRDLSPPATVHSMIRVPIFVGDMYSGDLFIEELERCGGRIEEGGRYLDFGCSSGAAVRYLAAAYPEARWFGCDPVVESIAWASENLPGIEFRVGPQWPPLPYEDNQFDGVYAISIWSHFSERAALAWFDEMARIVAPGGALMFTTHGAATLSWAVRTGWRSHDGIRAIASDLSCNRYRFEDVYSYNAEVLSQLDSISDWGDAFLPLAWVVLNLLRDWELVSFCPARNQANQDLYLLRRKTSA